MALDHGDVGRPHPKASPSRYYVIRQFATGNAWEKILGSAGEPCYLMRNDRTEYENKVTICRRQAAIDRYLYALAISSFGDRRYGL